MFAQIPYYVVLIYISVIYKLSFFTSQNNNVINGALTVPQAFNETIFNS